jgi:hypothetical protein
MTWSIFNTKRTRQSAYLVHVLSSNWQRNEVPTTSSRLFMSLPMFWWLHHVTSEVFYSNHHFFQSAFPVAQPAPADRRRRSPRHNPVENHWGSENGTNGRFLTSFCMLTGGYVYVCLCYACLCICMSMYVWAVYYVGVYYIGVCLKLGDTLYQRWQFKNKYEKSNKLHIFLGGTQRYIQPKIACWFVPTIALRLAVVILG